MSTKILVTSVGKGKYSETEYANSESESTIKKTEYAFDAIIENENPKPNKILFIGPKDSDWMSLTKFCSGETDDNDKLKNANNLSIEDEKVREHTEEIIRDKRGFDDVKILILPYGKKKDEIENYFNSMKDALYELIKSGSESAPIDSPEIIFDITNGFRSIPLYIIMLTKYIGFIVDTKVSYKAYYGMFDAKDTKGRTPLVDLTRVTDMTEWINAISEFRNFGSVKTLVSSLKKENSDNKYNDIIETLDNFEYGMNSNNLYYLRKGVEMLSNKESIEEKFKNEPAKSMMQELSRYFKSYFEKDFQTDKNTNYDNSYFLTKIGLMYIQQGRMGAASVALQESLVTYIMEKYLREIINKEIQSENIIFEYNYRNKIKNYFDKYISENNNDYQNKEFFECYSYCKDTIRNVDAHILNKQIEIGSYEDKYYNLKKMAKSILCDMKSKSADGIKDVEKFSMNISGIFEDFDTENFHENKNDTKAIKCILTSKKNGKWVFLSETELENLITDDKNKKIIDENYISKEKIRKLYKELNQIGENGYINFSDNKNTLHLLGNTDFQEKIKNILNSDKCSRGKLINILTNNGSDLLIELLKNN